MQAAPVPARSTRRLVPAMSVVSGTRPSSIAAFVLIMPKLPLTFDTCHDRIRFTYAGSMRLSHLGLLVLDQERSQEFYARYFGFDPATATRYPDGTVIIRDRDGFDLALHAGTRPAGHPEFLHF